MLANDHPKSSFAAAPWHDKDLVVSTACDYKPGPKRFFHIAHITMPQDRNAFSKKEVSINGGALKMDGL